MNLDKQKLMMMDEERRLYFLRHLPTQCINAHEFERVQQLLTSFDFIETKIDVLQSEDGVNQLLADYTSSIAANADIYGIFGSLATAVRLSTTILMENSKQTFPQIYSRLLSETTPSLRTLLDNYKPSYPWLRMRSKTMFSAGSALVRTLVGPDTEVLDCALSNDARIALSASSDHTLRIWNLETGLCEHVLQGHTGAVNSCALSADGRLALSASTDTTLRLWDTKTGQCLGVFEGHTKKVTGCALSDDATFFLSSSYDQTVRLWNIQTQTCVILSGHEERVTCCALSVDGRFALSGSYDQTLRLWDVTTHECLRIINDEFGGITHCVFSRDGQLCLSTSVTYLIEWENRDSATGDTPITLFYNPEDKGESELKTGLGDYWFNVLFNIIQNAGITSEILDRDSIISVWEVSSGKCIRELKGHQGSISGLSLSKDGKRLLSCTESGEMNIWDMESWEHVPSLFEATGGVNCCAIDRTGDMALSSAQDGSIYVWSIPLAMRNTQVMTKENNGDAIIWCKYNPAGELALSVSYNRTVQQWDAQTGELVSQINVAELPMLGSIDVSIERQIAIVTSSVLGFEQETKELKIFDIQAGKAIQTLSGHTDWISSCAIDQKGKIALSADNSGILRIWDLEDYTCRFVLEGHEDQVGCCVFSADGLRAFSGSNDTTLRIWDTQTGRCLHVLRGHSAGVRGCVFSADGRRGLSVGADNALCFWDPSSGILLHKHMSQSELSDPCALNADGKLALYVTLQKTIHLAEIEIGQDIAVFTFDININSIAFSPQGQDIMAGDASGHTHFLHIEEGVSSNL